jgi:hypothetical protein
MHSQAHTDPAQCALTLKVSFILKSLQRHYYGGVASVLSTLIVKLSVDLGSLIIDVWNVDRRVVTVRAPFDFSQVTIDESASR